MSITRDIKNALRGSNGALIRLIIINICVWLAVNIISSLMTVSGNMSGEEQLENYLALPDELNFLVYRFWTIISYMFLQVDLMHLLGNMLMLWFLGRVFSDLLGGARMTGVYLIGGICGGVLFIIIENLLDNGPSNLQGASAAIMAIVIAVAAYSPDYTMFPFGFQMKLKWLALIAFLLTSVIDLSANTGGKVSHIGGAIFGFIYGTQLRQGRSFMEKFSSLFKRKNKHLRVEYTRSQRVDDLVYNERKLSIRRQVDEILDKISRSGYDSLNKEEKEFLQKNHDKF
jgi:membrane associated rhomboid family serine protease